MKTKHQMQTRRKMMGSMAAMALLGNTLAQSAIIGQLGILDDSANGGINPATGSAWKAGDKYRLIFITSTTRTADSTDIADYNSFVQTVAAAAGFGSVNWSAVGSTSTVTAITNTGTAPETTGVGIFNFSSIKIADNNSDLWDGGIDNPVDYTENNDLLPDFTNVVTGTDPSGVQTNDLGTGTTPKALGGNDQSPPSVQYGRSHFADGRWTRSFSGNASSEYRFYALSEELTVVPEPSSMVILGLGGLALILRRRK